MHVHWRLRPEEFCVLGHNFTWAMLISHINVLHIYSVLSSIYLFKPLQQLLQAEIQPNHIGGM